MLTWTSSGHLQRSRSAMGPCLFWSDKWRPEAEWATLAQFQDLFAIAMIKANNANGDAPTELDPLPRPLHHDSTGAIYPALVPHAGRTLAPDVGYYLLAMDGVWVYIYDHLVLSMPIRRNSHRFESTKKMEGACGSKMLLFRMDGAPWPDPHSG